MNAKTLWKRNTKTYLNANKAMWPKPHEALYHGVKIDSTHTSRRQDKRLSHFLHYYSQHGSGSFILLVSEKARSIGKRKLTVWSLQWISMESLKAHRKLLSSSWMVKLQDVNQHTKSLASPFTMWESEKKLAGSNSLQRKNKYWTYLPKS